MEGYSRKDPQLLDLIPKGREWVVNMNNQETSSEEKKLELRLGPPGEQDWIIKHGGSSSSTKNNFKESDGSSCLLALGYSSNMSQNSCPVSNRGFLDQKSIDQGNTSWMVNGSQTSSPWSSSSSSHDQESLPPIMGKESLLQTTEKMAFSPAGAAANNNTAVPNSSQKRTAPAPVVGWPPIRSFRKNLASGSTSKLPRSPEPRHLVPKKIGSEKQVENLGKGLFVKINMDGVPIGRKVDLKAYDSYEKLSCAVDELFRSFLAAQRDLSAGTIQNNQEKEKAFTGLLDGSGEYTLVYEDNEGDRMLVGDVPWHMFVSSVKRLRVLKSSELSSLFLGSKRKNNQLDATMRC